MWKRLFRLLLSLVVGVAMAQVALSRMRPPLFKEYHRIEEELYTKYLADGVLPEPQALSASTQKTLSEHTEIRYTVNEGLSYRYDKPYPLNAPFIGFVTFGLCWGGEEGCVGESQSPESLIHNAKLRAGRSPSLEH
jgi:hypothetical protein